MTQVPVQGGEKELAMIEPERLRRRPAVYVGTLRQRSAR